MKFDAVKVTYVDFLSLSSPLLSSPLLSSPLLSSSLSLSLWQYGLRSGPCTSTLARWVLYHLSHAPGPLLFFKEVMIRELELVFSFP
jgi:hypothetical protein